MLFIFSLYFGSQEDDFVTISSLTFNFNVILLCSCPARMVWLREMLFVIQCYDDGIVGD